MKRFSTLLVVTLLAAVTHAQLLVKETFNDYPTGSLSGQGSPAWIPYTVSGGTPDIQVQNTTPLTYSGYSAGGGNYISVANRNAGTGRSFYKFFSRAVNTTNASGAPTQTFYYSFLVRVSDAVMLTSGDAENYSVALRNSSGTTGDFSTGRFSIHKNAAGNWVFGVAAGGSFTYYNTNTSSTSQTFLVLMRYDMIPGPNNDIAYMWVNPSMGTEPSTASATVSSGGNLDYGTKLDALMVLQRDNGNRPVAQFDGFITSVGTSSSAAYASLAESTPAPAQIVEDNFTGYASGSLNGQGNPAWIAYNSGGSPDIQVQSTTPLVYSGYPSGGPYISAADRNAGTGRSSYKMFNYPVMNLNITGSSTQVFFYTFLVRVSSASTATDVEAYSISLRNSTGTTGDNSVGRFYIKKEAATGNWMFGVSAGRNGDAGNTANTVAFYNTGNNSTTTTFFITMRYDLIPGSNNDMAYMWVNALPGSEPTTSTAVASAAGTVDYGDRLDALMVFERDNGNRPAVQFDAFRVAVAANSAMAYANLQLAANTPLPVALQSFSAYRNGAGALLQWNASFQSDLSGYELQKSADGRSFTAIGVLAANANGRYNYTDGQLFAGNNFYRLKIINTDGSFSYSSVITVRSSEQQNIDIFPNPAQSTIVVEYPKAAKTGSLQIVSLGGQLLKEMPLAENQVASTINVSELATGAYYIIVKSGAQQFTAKLVKQ